MRFEMEGFARAGLVVDVGRGGLPRGGIGQHGVS